jgi:small-conductance mechanosensitive channel
MKNMKEKIQEAGLTIAFPKREIHLVKDNRSIPIDVPAEKEA